jgi:hypothetical protein
VNDGLHFTAWVKRTISSATEFAVVGSWSLSACSQSFARKRCWSSQAMS